MSRKVYVAFFRLRKNLARTPIHCPSCGIIETIEDLPHHVETVHGINSKTMCPYCVGRYRWRGGRIYSEVNSAHFIECMQECIRDMKVYTEPIPPVHPVTSKDSMSDACETCTTQYKPNANCVRKPDRMNEYVGLHEPLFEIVDFFKPERDIFDETKGMYNDIIGIVNRYMKNDLEWHHLFIKNDVFHIFKEEMSKIKNELVALPYWCLCDGLTKDKIVHRHMIVACKIGSKFRKVWKYKVRYDTNKGNRGKNSVRIKSLFHLINVIQYVSQPKSSCNRGEEICSMVDEKNACLGHHDINKPLSKHAVAFMSLLFSGGVEKLCTQQNKSKNVVNWFDHAKKRYGKWGAPLKVTGFKFLKCVIPLLRDLEPTDEETDLFLIWMNDRIMYLKENPELNALSNAEWYRHQMRKGNTFRSISDEIYVYVKSQQNAMNQLEMHDKRVMEKSDKKYLGLRNRSRDNETNLKRKLNELEREKDAEIAHLRTQLATKDDEITRLKNENFELKIQKKKKILRLKVDIT